MSVRTHTLPWDPSLSRWEQFARYRQLATSAVYKKFNTNQMHAHSIELAICRLEDRLLRVIDSFDAKAGVPFAGYAMTCLNRAAINLRRDCAARGAIDNRTAVDRDDQASIDQYPSDVEGLLSTLTSIERCLLYLTMVDGYSQEAAGQMLPNYGFKALSRGAVNTAIKNAKEKVAQVHHSAG